MGTVTQWASGQARRGWRRRQSWRSGHSLHALCSTPPFNVVFLIYWGLGLPVLIWSVYEMRGHWLFQNNLHGEPSDILFGYNNHSFYYQVLSCIPNGYYCRKWDFQELRCLLWKFIKFRRCLHHLIEYRSSHKIFSEISVCYKNPVFLLIASGRILMFSRSIKSLKNVATITWKSWCEN